MNDLDLGEIAYTPTSGVRRLHRTELVVATETTLEGYGCLVDDPQNFPIEIVRWPAQGWRPVDPNSGDQGGVTEGVFEFWWKGEILYARNNAVGDSYLFAWSKWPEEAATDGPAKPRQQALVWRANYHPDGGQLFYPLHREQFIVPLAPPGDNVKPEDFVAFWCDGKKGLYIHRISGMAQSCRWMTMPNCSTGRAGSTPECRSISPRNSAATSPCPCNRPDDSYAATPRRGLPSVRYRGSSPRISRRS